MQCNHPKRNGMPFYGSLYFDLTCLTFKKLTNPKHRNVSNLHCKLRKTRHSDRQKKQKL